MSAELLQNEPAFREKTRDKVRGMDKARRFEFFDQPVTPGAFEVVFVLVAKWRGRELHEALPFFSRITLRQTVDELTSRGYRVSCLRVPYSE